MKISAICALAIIPLLVAAACASTGNEEGEESGNLYSLDQTHDEVRRGLRLVVSYDDGLQSFRGTVTNTTAQTIDCVRVEIHLSNGVELGPTPQANLAADGFMPVVLDASGQSAFERWSAHPESGCGGSGEHGNESEREHDG